jgi:hypothetical protein
VQQVWRLQRKIFFHRDIDPDIFQIAGYDQFQAASQTGACSGEQATIGFNGAGRIDPDSFAKKVDFEFCRIQRFHENWPSGEWEKQGVCQSNLEDSGLPGG